MRRGWLVLGGAGSVLLLAACIVAPWSRYHRVPRRSETLVVAEQEGLEPRLDLSFSYGELEILGPATSGFLEVDWTADVEELLPELIESQEGGEHWVRLSTGTHALGFNLWDLDEMENHWKVRAGRERPFDLEVNFGGGSLRAQLGGMPLRSARLRMAACEAEVRFDVPNPATLDLLEISAAACEAEFRGLGNAGFRRLEASLGSGSFVLDFQGTWPGTAEAFVTSKMGEVTVRLPSRVSACVVNRSHFTTDFESSLEYRDGQYVTAGYDESKVQLIVHVDYSMGSVEVWQE